MGASRRSTLLLLLLPAATAALAHGSSGVRCSRTILGRHQRTTVLAAAGPEDDLSESRPIDSGALALEREQDDYRTASRAEMAECLPAWAAELMLNPEVADEYEIDQASRRAAELHAKRVDGRSWDDMHAHEGEGAGMAEFTPEELAEDYGLPLETVCEQMLALGVEAKRLDMRAPVKGACTQQQQAELLAFLGSADPIAAREELCDRTLSEMADSLPLSEEQLLALCRQNEIRTVLGAETRIRADDHASLLDAAELEIAFGGGERR